MVAALSGLPALVADTVARLLLHGGHPHAAESSTTVGMEYVAASVAFVGLVGGLLYWYYGERVRSP